MCNACGFGCCAFDSFDGCGCDCEVAACRMERCDWCGEMVDVVLGDGCACDDEDEFYDSDVGAGSGAGT